MGTYTHDVAVLFVATNSAGLKGVWSALLDPISHLTDGPTPLIQQDDDAAGAGAVRDVSISDSANTQGKCAVWVQTDAGQAVLLGNIPGRLPVILVHGWRPERLDNKEGNPVDVWRPLESMLRDEGYADLSKTSGSLDAGDPLPGRFYIEFTYANLLKEAGYPDASGDPRLYAASLSNTVASFRPRYKGQFDLVCHSMGALVSRWYMDKLGGATSIRQWIGIAPVDRGAALADLRDKNLWPITPVISLLSPDWKPLGAITQMETLLPNNTVGQLNSLNDGWPLIQRGVTYRVLVGYNKTALDEGKNWKFDPQQYPCGAAFRDAPLGRTCVRIPENTGTGQEDQWRWTYYGDGTVALEQSKLSENGGIEMFPNDDHSGLLKDPRVLSEVMTNLLSPQTPVRSNGPSLAQLQQDAVQVSKVELASFLLHMGERRISKFFVDNVKTMWVWAHLPGSELALTLQSPSGQVIPSTSTNGTVVYVSPNEVAFMISAPEQGEWQAVVDGIDVATNGEQCSVSVEVESPWTLDLDVQSNQTAFPVGTPFILSAALENSASPFAGAAITGQIIGPDGSTNSLAFYDDGTHGDTNAGDGVFASAVRLQQPGPYLITVEAAAQIDSDTVQRVASASVSGQTSGPVPVLDIAGASGFVDLSWVDPTATFQLQSSTDLSPNHAWAAATNAPAATMNEYGLVVPTGGQQNFYRLARTPPGIRNANRPGWHNQSSTNWATR